MSNLKNLSECLTKVDELSKLIYDEFSQYAKDYDAITTYYYDQDDESFNLSNKDELFCLPMMFFLSQWQDILPWSYNIDCDSNNLTYDHFFPHLPDNIACKLERICVKCGDNDHYGCMTLTNKKWEWMCDCCYEGIEKH